MTKSKHNIIKDQEHYLTSVNFFIKYVNSLINKPHILRKKQLRDIKHRLMTKGHIQFRYHYNLLNTYLKQEKNIDYINTYNLLCSLELHNKEQKRESSTFTLPI
jgi:hypothetical protein